MAVLLKRVIKELRVLKIKERLSKDNVVKK